MDWQASSKYAILICDAPAHWDKYNWKFIYDSYPELHLKGFI